ncbi:tRNA (guanosine(46)-N7)-methyltransferase TrmB [Microbacterium pseudoresistens]|uniref:tRNA (guanine-N(7)-)-methyltransferase n=1 Tax=Microbacterium pseudoresistens TaxID=640634 RepID=A0A7Y9EW38_9MICO|nr:tRNA (guanosine(46)-N7)-methyltransferase TrmB [Microbacterium pseudoresistens]NYD55035.1 tRNA (guanine-N7-)-methyltransferase [Microbacterium pseudoresistens]
MPDRPTFREEPVSFVRRSGRMSEAQERAFVDLAPHYLIEVPRDTAWTSVHPDALMDAAERYGRRAPLVVEVGSGQGHAIVAAAAVHPDTDFLAVEVFRAGLARTMLDADRAGVRNLRLIEANAPEVLSSFLPAGSADEVWVFFPDPWHKKRHTKRRLVRAGFGAIAGHALRDGGLLRLATDWEEYAVQMRDVLDAEPEFVRAFEGDWAERFDGRVMTAFERKGIAKGREIRDLVYRRVSQGAG